MGTGMRLPLYSPTVLRRLFRQALGQLYSATIRICFLTFAGIPSHVCSTIVNFVNADLPQTSLALGFLPVSEVLLNGVPPPTSLPWPRGPGCGPVVTTVWCPAPKVAAVASWSRLWPRGPRLLLFGVDAGINILQQLYVVHIYV